MKVKKIAVLGGGASGTISALILKQRFPQIDITLIMSEKIGTMGVGEGITEHWKIFQDYLELNSYEVIKKTGATFKAGLKFVNWGKEDYMHSLHSAWDMNRTGYMFRFGHLIANNKPKKDLTPHWIWENESPINFYNEQSDIPVNQYHFDAKKLNTYLLELCERFDINVQVDDICDVQVSDDGNLEKLISESKEYSADFFVDASGFKRILPQVLDMKWISYNEFLPVNKAFVFETEEMEEHNMFTTITAQKNGWSWRTPVQGRTGNGYVYNSQFISDEDAVKEIESFYKRDLKINKFFNFNSGRLEKSWFKNCLSVGLSANFIEPLEASSLGTVIQQVFCFLDYLPSWDVDTYNQRMIEVFDNSLDFVRAHYLVKREDSDFWKYVKYKLKTPDSLKNLLNLWRNRLPNSSDLKANQWCLFNRSNYIQVLYGLDWFDLDKIREEYEYFPYKDVIEEDIYARIYEERRLPRIGHKELINKICNCYE